MMLHLASNTIPDIFFAVNQCDRFTYNTNEFHEIDVKRIYWNLQGTKDNGLVFNPFKKLVVDRYTNADCFGLW